MTIQKAFISDAAFTIDDHGYAAVVTAEAIDRDTGKMQITCDILGYCEAVSITLNQDDLIAVRDLLGLPNQATVQAYHDAFDVALKALQTIAGLEDEKRPDEWTNDFKYLEALDFAQQALRKIDDPDATDCPLFDNPESTDGDS